jgi:phosphomevalonate kinase
VDVAASVFGGVLRYQLSSAGAEVRPAALPTGLHWTAYWTGTSARTSDLLAEVRELHRNDERRWDDCLQALAATAASAATAAGDGHLDRFLGAARAQGEALQRLGRAAGVAIVPDAFTVLDRLAAERGGTFLPSGAGGGDIGLYIGRAPPAVPFERAARAFGMCPLPLDLDEVGLAVVAPAA